MMCVSFIPASWYIWIKLSESILSNVLSGRSFRYAHMTSLPKPRNTPESSAAMYPAPKTIALLGNSVNSKIHLNQLRILHQEWSFYLHGLQ